MPILFRVPAGAWIAAGMGGAVALSLLARFEIASLPWALALAVIWVTACMTFSWMRLDEPAREAHKFAWWWGGSVPLALLMAGCAALPFLSGARDQIAHLLQASYRGVFPPESAAFVKGVYAAALVQAVGYGLAWAGWWLAKR